MRCFIWYFSGLEMCFSVLSPFGTATMRDRFRTPCGHDGHVLSAEPGVAGCHAHAATIRRSSYTPKAYVDESPAPWYAWCLSQSSCTSAREHGLRSHFIPPTRPVPPPTLYPRPRPAPASAGQSSPSCPRSHSGGHRARASYRDRDGDGRRGRCGPTHLPKPGRSGTVKCFMDEFDFSVRALTV
jgi:hypothetical protein